MTRDLSAVAEAVRSKDPVKQREAAEAAGGVEHRDPAGRDGPSAGRRRATADALDLRRGWALALLAPATAAAERAAGISGNLNLVRFDTAAPGEAQVRLITGLETSGEKAIGLDTPARHR